MTKPSKFRSKKLIHDGLQLRLTAKFAGVAVLAMCLQFLFLGYRLMSAMESLDGRGGDLAYELPALLLETLGLSMLVILPAMAFVGVLLTFRVAGPAYRIENYLRDLAEHGGSAPCKIRDGDELQDLCEAVNLATEALRQAKGSEGEASAAGAAEQAA